MQKVMDTATCCIQNVDTLVLFGGGRLLLKTALKARSLGLQISVFLSPRHAGEQGFFFEGVFCSLEEALKREKKISCHITEDINTCKVFTLLANRNLLGLGFGETYTFSRESVAMFQGRLFDMMVIPLPEYRGGAHFTWQILRGSRRGCWSIQEINEEMIPGRYDSGKIWESHEYIIPQGARIPRDYFEVAEREGEVLLEKFFSKIQKGEPFFPFPVQERFASFFPRLHTLSHGWVDWSWNAEEIERFCCAFDAPYPGASSLLDNQRVFLRDVQHDPAEGNFHPFMAGLIYRILPGAVFLAARDGALMVRSITDETGDDVLPRLRVGVRLVTPREILDQALACSVDYDAEGLTLSSSES